MPCICRKKVKLKIKLADGKERTLQHMSATTFYSPEGKPISAAQFIERLYGDLPELFKDEDELRSLWSKPDTRKKLMVGLEEMGYGQEELKGIKQLIDAENSDLYDVLSYIAFASFPITRKERVETRKHLIFENYNDKQRDFLSFVLNHYVNLGVEELAEEKLPILLELKYNTLNDAIRELDDVSNIRNIFVGFQEHLYMSMVA
jgi:type I restriction enzyme R subunit